MQTATRTSSASIRRHHHPDTALGEKRNRVYIEDGEVKWDFVTDTMSIEEAKELLHQVIDLEYSLP